MKCVKTETISLDRNGAIKARICELPGGNFCALAQIPINGQKVKIRVTATSAELRPMIVRWLIASWQQYNRMARASGAAYVGLFGFIKKAIRKVKKIGSKVLKSKVIRGIRKVAGKVTRLAGKVLNNKYVRGAMKIAKYVPVYGQAASAIYQGARKGLAVANKAMNVADKLARGNRKTKRQIRAMNRAIKSRRVSPAVRRRLIQTRSIIRRAYARRYGIGRGGRRMGYYRQGGRPQWRRGYGRGYRPRRIYYRRGRGYVRGTLPPATHVRAMEGAKWLWDELKPRRGVSESFYRNSYREGLRALAQ